MADRQTPPGGASDEQLSYEEARAQLSDIVRQLESGGASLNDSMKLWERGEELAAICQRWLDGAKAKVQASRAAAEGRGESSD
ncbi:MULTISPECIES: exodeoxyribonuclease VII small subunit [Aestuariimicrobium]|uniref:exodeoxyribonuclease VII small subunit n=1 Tax=Aestuariimicrobium TaxID=396388 RepID=UPI0003B5973B|nr:MULTISPECIES: exodeoxyribonuclease VII small subunit [Aestuariimicrobium]CAI9400491.1 Exodeoxyribonuclease 7 small subunit [Aestuariimicrobium sp. T2.26MG-19.2B]